MARYCQSKGKSVETEIMLLSSYAPLRLQRVLYQDASCFLAADDGRHVCRTDLFTASPLDPRLTLPVLSSTAVTQTDTLYEICTSGRAFDLYAESLEFYDHSNLVVAVRRASMADLGGLLLLTESAGGKLPVVGGRTVYYFVQTGDVTRAREGQPWPTTAFGNSPADINTTAETHLLFATCPALRVLPDAGGVVGHSLAAVAHAMRLVTNLALNPFAIFELLDARAARACPEDSLRHSALGECGMALLSLDRAFEQAYAASTAVWNVVLWLVQIVFPPDGASVDARGRPTAAALLRSLLQGVAVTGDATRVITLFDISSLLSTFDLGLEDFIEGDGGRRRRRTLLQTDDADKEEEGGPPRRRLLRGRMRAAGQSVMNGVHGGLMMGARGFFSAGKLAISFASGNLFAGADFSGLLSTQSPHLKLAGAVVSAPAIAWSEFTYKAGLPMVLDVVASVRQGQPSVSPLWLHLHDAWDLFDQVVDTRLRQACAGVRLMVGYDSQLGRGLFYSCMAAADMPAGMLRVASTLFADVPLYRCLCVYPAGLNYLDYVRAECPPYIPPTRKAYWQALVVAANSGADGGVSGMCRTYLEGIESQALGAFDEWLVHADQSATALASFLDELLVPNVHAGGSCANVVGNPTAVVLTPMPLLHFQVCAKTTVCLELCADPIGLFDYERRRLAAAGYNPSAPPSSFDLSVESPFFNRYAAHGGAASSSSGGLLLAIATLPTVNATTSCQARCGVAGPKGRCLATLRQMATARLRVDFYCIPDPSMILSTIFPTTLDSYELLESDTMQSALVRRTAVRPLVVFPFRVLPLTRRCCRRGTSSRTWTWCGRRAGACPTRWCTRRGRRRRPSSARPRGATGGASPWRTRCGCGRAPTWRSAWRARRGSLRPTIWPQRCSARCRCSAPSLAAAPSPSRWWARAPSRASSPSARGRAVRRAAGGADGWCSSPRLARRSRGGCPPPPPPRRPTS
jgi:hypothetical protein